MTVIHKFYSITKASYNKHIHGQYLDLKFISLQYCWTVGGNRNTQKKTHRENGENMQSQYKNIWGLCGDSAIH